MESKLLFEIEKLREMLYVSIKVLNEFDPLTSYGQGYRDSRIDVLKHIDGILKEVNK